MRTSLVQRFLTWPEKVERFKRALAPEDPEPTPEQKRRFTGGTMRPHFWAAHVKSGRTYDTLGDLARGKSRAYKERVPDRFSLNGSHHRIEKGIVEGLRVCPDDVTQALDDLDAEIARLELEIAAIKKAQAVILEDGYARGEEDQGEGTPGGDRAGPPGARVVTALPAIVWENSYQRVIVRRDDEEGDIRVSVETMDYDALGGPSWREVSESVAPLLRVMVLEKAVLALAEIP